MGWTFFGLTSENVKQYRVNIFTEIHEICFHGQGGYSWSEVYNMPIWLRRFTFRKIKEHYDKQSESIKHSSNQQSVINPDGTVKPGFAKSKTPPKYK